MMDDSRMCDESRYLAARRLCFVNLLQGVGSTLANRVVVIFQRFRQGGHYCPSSVDRGAVAHRSKCDQGLGRHEGLLVGGEVAQVHVVIFVEVDDLTPGADAFEGRAGHALHKPDGVWIVDPIVPVVVRGQEHDLVEQLGIRDGSGCFDRPVVNLETAGP